MANIFGTPGDDQLIGTSDPDLMCGFEESDLLFGAAGNDDLRGGRGAYSETFTHRKHSRCGVANDQLGKVTA